MEGVRGGERDGDHERERERNIGRDTWRGERK